MTDWVLWTPYENQYILGRAPQGIAILCTRGHLSWKTTRHLVFDVHVEPYHAHIVMKQFGMYHHHPSSACRQLDESLHTLSLSMLMIAF
uniref:Uncharacterized protein n=1 Tax=Leersia perrieri TaxID=77586 RepID=A0A0D9XZ15_9ORYZ